MKCENLPVKITNSRAAPISFDCAILRICRKYRLSVVAVCSSDGWLSCVEISRGNGMRWKFRKKNPKTIHRTTYRKERFQDTFCFAYYTFVTRISHCFHLFMVNLLPTGQAHLSSPSRSSHKLEKLLPKWVIIIKKRLTNCLTFFFCREKKCG